MTPLEHALAYAARGWRVAPVPPGYKYPHGLDRWQDHATTNPDTIRQWWTTQPDHGICIATGPQSGIIAIDIDPRHHGDEGWQQLVNQHGDIDTVEAITGGGGRHLLFNDGGHGITNGSNTHLPPGIDVRGAGGQIVVAPTIHPDTGARYEWEIEHDPLDGHPIADLPPWLLELLTRPAVTQTARRDTVPYTGVDSIVDLFAANHTWPQLLEAEGWQLHSVRTTTDWPYELWTRPGKELRAGASASLYYGGTDVLKVFTSSCPPLAAEETYTRFGFWTAIHHAGDHRAAAREYRLQLNAREHPPKAQMTDATPPTERPAAPPPAATSTDDDGDTSAPGEQPFTDLGNARRLVGAHGHDLRYAPQWGTWLAWDGLRWAQDVTDETERRAKAVVDGFVTQIATTTGSETRKKLAHHWIRSQSATRIEAMVRLARSEPGIGVTVTALDADPWLLNTRSGVIDLRAGTLATAERRHLVTKLAPVRHDPAATCPTWVWFIDWAMRGDHELVQFLQRAVGYSLTGSVAEQCLFFLHGSGENGKSTFLNVIQRLAGDYALAAEADLLLATNHDRHSTGIADLVGRRLVVVQETDEGRRLAEATVKQLTGGDMVRARRMRQDNFEFAPTHKLWMAANHRPAVRGTDHGIWRRIRMIPFLAAVAPGQRDTGLTDRLLAELPGILNWALDGCRQWQQHGLQAPSAVLEATREYRAEQDHVGRFLDECCTVDTDVAITATELRRIYERWCEEGGERPWSSKALAPQLTDRGCAAIRFGSQRERLWVGVGRGDRPDPVPPAFLTTAAGMEWLRGRIGTPDRDIRVATDLPGDSSTRMHRDTTSCSALARARTGTYTDEASLRVRAGNDTDDDWLF